jgi:hypothetical protein
MEALFLKFSLGKLFYTLLSIHVFDFLVCQNCKTILIYRLKTNFNRLINLKIYLLTFITELYSHLIFFLLTLGTLYLILGLC